MAVEQTAGGTTITGPDIEVFRWMTIRRGLKLEIETGMKMSRGRPMATIIREAGISSARNKRVVYADLDAFMVANGLESVPLKD